MGRQSLNETLMALREGRISLDKFVRLVHGDVYRMANGVFERWKKAIPPGIEPTDIYQEMMTSALSERRDLDWQPDTKNKNGEVISISVHWNWHMHTAVYRWIQDQRKSHRRSGKNPSRFPICMAFFRDDDVEDGVDEFEQFGEAVCTQPGQANEQAARQVLLEAYDNLPIPMAVAWAVYIKEGDVDAAAKRIDASPGLGTTCQASTFDEAKTVVKRAVHKGRAIARALGNTVAA